MALRVRVADDRRPSGTALTPAELVLLVLYLVMVGLAAVACLQVPAQLIPLGLSLGCLVLWLVARRQLGNAFTVDAQARHLVTSGIYSRVRHPIYVFGTMAFMLALLAISGWSALVVWAVFLPVQVVRARREERVLRAAFGAEYEEYRATTWF